MTHGLVTHEFYMLHIHVYPFHTRNLGRPECAFIARSVRHECTHFISTRDECGVEKAPSNLPLYYPRFDGALIEHVFHELTAL